MLKNTLALLSIAFVVAGCGSSTNLFAGGRPLSAQTQHPGKVGVEQVPPILYDGSALERQRGLPPGSLQQEARVVRADPQGLCFNVTLRGLDDPRFPDLRNWTVHFRSVVAGEEAESVQDDAPNIELIPVQSQQFQGLVPIQVQVGTETVCSQTDNTGRCIRWREDAIYSTSWQPGPVMVSTGGGNICYPNTQHLTVNTRAMALRLNAGNNSGGASAGPRRLTYQWNIAGAGGPAAAPATSGGQTTTAAPAAQPANGGQQTVQVQESSAGGEGTVQVQ